MKEVFSSRNPVRERSVVLRTTQFSKHVTTKKKKSFNHKGIQERKKGTQEIVGNN